MDKQLAERLLDELGRHSAIVAPDRELFLDLLVSTEIPGSSSFYEFLPDKKQLVEETGQYHHLSLSRVLRNRNAKDYQLSQWKKNYEAFASAFGIYSSDALTRDLRANKDLVGMMDECKEPFSLLGKFKTYNYEKEDKPLLVLTKPILVIPDAKDMQLIYNWENANTKYEKESRPFLIPIRTKITHQEYFSS